MPPNSYAGNDSAIQPHRTHVTPVVVNRRARRYGNRAGRGCLGVVVGSFSRANDVRLYAHAPAGRLRRAGKLRALAALKGDSLRPRNSSRRLRRRSSGRPAPRPAIRDGRISVGKLPGSAPHTSTPHHGTQPDEPLKSTSGCLCHAVIADAWTHESAKSFIAIVGEERRDVRCPTDSGRAMLGNPRITPLAAGCCTQ
jgi:hypothetical protein